MATLEQLIVLIDANTELMRQELAKAEGAVTDFGQQTGKQLGTMNGMFTKLGNVARTGLGLLGISMGVVGFARFAQGAIQGADAIGDMAKQAGFTAERFQRLQVVFGQAGVDANSFAGAMRQLNTRFGQFMMSGTGPLKKTLDELGLTQRALNGEFKTSEDLFQAIVENFDKAGDSATQSAVATAAFGREVGSKMAPALRNGAEWLDKATQSADDFFSDEQVANADALTDAFSRMSTEIGVTLKGAIIDATTAIARFFKVRETMTDEEITKQIAYLKNLIGVLQSGGTLRGFALVDIPEMQKEIVALESLRAAREGDKPGGTGSSTLLEDQRRAEADKQWQDDLNRAEALHNRLRTSAEATAEELVFAASLLERNLLSQLDFDRLVAEQVGKGQQLTPELELYIDQLQRAQRLTDQMQLDVEKQVEQWREVQELMAVGLPTETATRMRDKLLPLIDLSTLPQKMEVVDESLERSKKKAEEFGTAFAAAFESRGIEAILSGDLRGGIQGFADDLAELILRITVLQPMAEQLALSLGNIGKGASSGAGAGGFFANLLGAFGFGKGTTPAPLSTTEMHAPPHLAGGGHLGAGQVAMVGESGPEWFVPDVAGSVLNSSQMRGGGTVIRQTFHVQAGLPPQWEAQLVGVGQLAASSAYRAVSQSNRGQR